MRCEQAQARARPVNPPPPVRAAPAPVLDPCQRGFLRLAARFAKEFLQKSAGPPVRQINIHKHRARGVEHLATVGIARHDRREFTGVVADFMQHLLAKRPVRIIRAVALKKFAGAKTIGETLRGLDRERLRLGKAFGRPAPADKIPDAPLGPKFREIHAPTLIPRAREDKRFWFLVGTARWAVRGRRSAASLPLRERFQRSPHIFKNSASSMIFTPSFCALSNFVPASSPART